MNGFLTLLRVLCILLFTWASLASSSASSSWSKESRLVVSLAGENRLDVYAIQQDGKLGLVSQTQLDGAPGTACFDHTGRYLYVGTSNPATISVFQAQPHGLKFLQSAQAADKPSFLSVTPNGQFLVSSYYQAGQVSVHRIIGEGRLSSEPLQVIDTAPRAHGIAIAPNGKFVFAPHTKPNAIFQFRMDPSSGKLTPNHPDRLQREAMIGPRHLCFCPDGQFAVGSNEQGRSISTYRFDSANGTLEHLQTLSSMPEDVTGKASTSHIEVHASGKFAYVANRGHGSIAVFLIDPATSLLKLVDRVPTAKVVRSFGQSEDGRFLTAAGQGSNRLINYSITSNGKLIEVSNVSVGKKPFWVSYYPAANVARRSGNSEEAQSVIPAAPRDQTLSLGQGVLTGEVTESSALIQTRLTEGAQLNEQGDLPGVAGVVRFEWSHHPDFADSKLTDFQRAVPQRDFIVRARLTGLKANTVYYYRPIFGMEKSNVNTGKDCSFRTLPGSDSDLPVQFIVGSCMNYIKFMHGRKGNAGGPLTATDEDKRLGFPAFSFMKTLKPDFFIGTGDIVYYDNPFRVAKTKRQLRKCWHEQFRFPRMVEFFRNTPTYWSKDDHDFRYNDSDNESRRLPLPDTGIGMFFEQLPIATMETGQPKTYRTIRISKHLQVWLTEGRDFRSANNSTDGPSKTLWGEQQRKWLQNTLQSSDAKWKLMINPTPMVGPDDGFKKDNHANLQGFRHEADAFFRWVEENNITGLNLVCGDRHWQYHSVHRTGINEFSCGALNDENARMGVAPGEKFGSDPGGEVRQLFTSPEPSGGFLQLKVSKTMYVTHYNDEGKQLYDVTLDDGR